MDLDILVPISAIAMVVAIVWITASTRVRSARIHAEAIGKLIDKLGSSQEAMAYLESESGQKLLEAVTVGRGHPYSRILGAGTAGVVLSALGTGLLILGATGVGDDEAIGGGIIVLALGLGFLLAAASSYRLSKSWGLVNGQETSSQT